MTVDPPEEGLRGAADAMRAEWRAEEEEITKAAFEQWRHGRSRRELLAECAGRGDTIHVTSATTTFNGPIVEIGPDRFTIATGSGLVDVALGASVVLGIDRHGAGTGETPARGTSMRARLLEHETTGVTVVVGTGESEVRGSIVVGADHVVVAEPDLERIVPLEAIVWVRAVDATATRAP